MTVVINHRGLDLTVLIRRAYDARAFRWRGGEKNDLLWDYNIFANNPAMRRTIKKRIRDRIRHKFGNQLRVTFGAGNISFGSWNEPGRIGGLRVEWK